MKLFRTENCPGCQDIEYVLKELCLACDVIIVKEKSDIPSSVPSSDAKLPFLTEDNILI